MTSLALNIWAQVYSFAGNSYTIKIYDWFTYYLSSFGTVYTLNIETP